MSYIMASAAAINYQRNYFANVFRQLMFLASRNTMIKQFTFHPIDVTAILFIFLDAVRNFKFHAIEPYRWALTMLMAVEPEIVIKTTRHNNQFTINIFVKLYCCASHLRVKLLRITSRCVTSDCSKVLVSMLWNWRK